MGESHDSAGSGPTVLVGIPAYNEAATIGTVVAVAQAHADEVFVVDDGSDDDTRARVRDTTATLLTHDRNRGYGETLATIFQYAARRGATHLVILDADGQHDGTDIPDLVRTQRETGAQIVSGSRFRGQSSSGMPRYRRAGLAVVNLLTNFGLRVGYSYSPISDTQCGFRAYNREAIRKLAEASAIGSGMGASLDILFVAAREGYDIVEVPTEVDYDVDDANTQNPVVHGVGLLTSLFTSIARDRPARMASVVATVVLTGAVLLLAVALSETGPVFLFVPVALVVGLLVAVTLSIRPPASDRPDQ